MHTFIALWFLDILKYQYPIDISQSTPYNIIFEGTRELYVWSDIAIDDIYFTPGLCTGMHRRMSE
jgi:hypothetical protein